MKHAKNPDAAFDLSGVARLKDLPTAPTCVGDIMTHNPVTMSPHDSFRESIGLMANRPFRHFPVVEPDGQLAGVISDRDLLRVLSREPNWESTTVADVMTQNTVTVQPETPLSTAIVEMLARRINCLPVVDTQGRVCGIVTSTDLLNTFQQVQRLLECLERVDGNGRNGSKV